MSPASEQKLFFPVCRLFRRSCWRYPAVRISTALMLLAARWRDLLDTKPKLVAVTVDHGLRKESRREALAVARLARKLKIAHRTLRWNGRKPATGLQEAARAARYRLLGDAARKAGAAHVVTAHTLDDQAETVLIRMTRGSGVTGLGAMAILAPSCLQVRMALSRSARVCCSIFRSPADRDPTQRKFLMPTTPPIATRVSRARACAR